MATTSKWRDLLGAEFDNLLEHSCQKISLNLIVQPSLDQVVSTFAQSDRSEAVLQSIRRLYSHGRLGGSGYLSILPVDQDIEHTAAYSFFHNPAYFDPQAILELALAGNVSAVASTLGILGLFSKSYAARLPFILKLNHNELLTLPPKHDQVMYAQVEEAAQMGAVAVGATIYFGSPQSNRQITEVSQAFNKAHSLGLATILWCYPRSEHYTKDGQSYESAIDISSQAIHLGVTIQADIVKQKMPTPQHGFQDLQFAKSEPQMYEQLLTDHPIDLVRYQVLHAYAGRIGLINSGGESGGGSDLAEAVKMAVINKRAGGQGLIMGRKVFKHAFAEGVQILHAVQDVYLDQAITLA